MAIEQRQSRRRAFEGWVEVQVEGTRRLASARDLSQTGIGLVFDAPPIPVDASVVCEFALPGISLPLELAGAVAWSDGSRAGVRFDAVDPGLAELLENHVDGRL